MKKRIYWRKGDASILVFAIILAGIFLTGIFSSFYTDIPLVPKPSETISPIPISNASQNIKAIDSGDVSQYTQSQLNAGWMYSSCSGCAMAAVMNAYGKHLTCGDVLQVEYNLGWWTEAMGILGDQGFVVTGNYFGFKTDISYARTLDDIIRIANSGTPIIVGVPQHILDVKGGDSQNVYLVDSGPHHFTQLTRDQFLHGGFLEWGYGTWWTGLSVIMTPK